MRDSSGTVRRREFSDITAQGRLIHCGVNMKFARGTVQPFQVRPQAEDARPAGERGKGGVKAV